MTIYISPFWLGFFLGAVFMFAVLVLLATLGKGGKKDGK